MKRSYHTFTNGNLEQSEMHVNNKVKLVDRNAVPLGIQLVSANKVGKRQHSDLVQLAEEISKADTFVKANTCNQLSIIAQQIKYLQQQAQQILQDAKANIDLHHIACNFQKVPGKTYHVYKRPFGQKYLSMLSPEEWNSPHEYLGSYRLEYDQSWTSIENIPKRDTELQMLDTIYHRNNIAIGIEDVSME